MDIYSYLQADHDAVEKLFNQFNKTEKLIRKQQIMAMIAQELMIHLQAEQESFYREIAYHNENKEEIYKSEQEHQLIKQKIQLILANDELGAAWLKEIEQLQKLIKQHVYEEEHVVFKQAKKLFSDKEACVLKEKMHYLKYQQRK